MEALHYCTMYDFRCCSTYPGQCEGALQPSPTTTGIFTSPITSFALTSQRLVLPPQNSTRICYINGAVNNNIMESMTTPTTDQMIDQNMEPQTRNRCNTWPRPVIDPSVHDSESNHSESVIKEEPEDFLQTEQDDDSQHNLSGGPDNISNQIGLNNCSELGTQNDSNAKKQSARKNAWGEYC